VTKTAAVAPQNGPALSECGGTHVAVHDDTAGQERRPRVGRPERVIDPMAGPLSRFAHDLRQLRAAAGYPTYRALARTALFSPSVLSTAASGMSFPTLQVTLAYAGACGGDIGDWRRRWEAVAAERARRLETDRAGEPGGIVLIRQRPGLRATLSGEPAAWHDGEHGNAVSAGVR
jgi:hypothetical protein